MSFLNIGQKIEKVIGKEVELLEAARTGNLQTVEKILASSSKVKKSHHVGGAIGQKLSSFLKSVNVNHTDKNGYTALHHAAVNGHRDVVEALLKSDAQPGLNDQQGCTPVHLAAWNGDAEIVMQLLTAGADSEVVNPVNVNQQNGTGDTALHCAAQYGHVAVVDVLLQKAANPTIRNLNEASPLDFAAQYGRLEVVQRLLISHPELARHPSSTQSPLHLASRNGHKDIAAVLLDHHFDIQTMTEMGNALHEAALHGKLDVVNLLLERGIDVNQRDYKGQTVLELLSAHQAQQKSFTEITKAIQEHMRQSGIQADSGLYESLSNCRSGVDKPTAAVKPLPPEKPHPSDKPCPPDKLQPTDSEKPTETAAHRPVPAPRLSVYHTSPDSEPEKSPITPMYSKPNKEKADLDRVVSSASSVPDEGPPPLPPRTSIFTSEERHSVLPQEPSIASICETSPPTGKVSLPKPRKPPRQKRSPAPARKSPPITSDQTDTTSEKPGTNIPEQNVNIPETVLKDTSDCEHPSQHSLQCTDQSHCPESDRDQSDSTITHSLQSIPPVKSPRSSLPPRFDDSSPDSQTGRTVSEGFYMEMSSVKKSTQVVRPISEVKPQVKETTNSLTVQLQPPSQRGADDYGMLFPNLRKMSDDLSKRPELRRMNTAPNPEEDDYVKPFPTSPTEKFKEKQGLLRRTNTAPEECTYLPMNNVTRDNAQKEGTLKEHEYAEIPEKDGSVSPVSPKENIYATIGESDQGAKLEVEADVYSQIKDLSPVPSLRERKDTKRENKDASETKEKHGETKEEIEDSNKEAREPTQKNGESEETRVEIGKSKEKIEIKEEGLKLDNTESDRVEESEKVIDNTKEETQTDEGNKAENANKGSPKPTHLEFLRSKPGAPLTPTGYPQPPTPDFPPPSPATAMLGIEMKIQQIDSKRKSKDITTITDDTLESIQEQKSEVKAAEEPNEVKVTKINSEVKVTAENKKTDVDGIESKQKTYLGDSESQLTGVSKPTDSQNTATVTVVSNEIIRADTDKSEEQTSVILSQNQSIPKSSIPETVIESEEDKMSKKGPPIPKKPDFKARSIKAKEPENVSKTNTVVGIGSVHVKVTKEGSDTKNRTSPVGDSAGVKVTEPEKDAKNSTTAGDTGSVKVREQEKDAKNSTTVGDTESVKVREQEKDAKNSTTVGDAESVKVREQMKDAKNSTAVGDADSVKVREQEKDAKNSTADGGGSPVVMRRKTSTPDMDVFKGLLRGSTIGSPFKERSKFYNEVIRKSQARIGEPKPLKTAMEKDEDIDIDQVMESINVEVAKRASASESTAFDDSEEWEKIADIMSSFGGNLTSFSSPTHSPSEEEFNVAFEAYMDTLLEKRERGSGQMISVGEWLESVNMGQYENAFVANGYDNIDYLDSNILEEQDLEQIGVLIHEHRQKILQATKLLPLLKPIDADDLPPSVEEWLMSLQLPEYLETFTSHGYDTMEKVQSILWELQLRTVLDISTLGHRKRILASLGERKPLDRHTPTPKKRSLSSLSPEDRSPFNNLDLYKDYTNVKPVSSSEEDIKESSQMVVDSSEDDDVFRQKKTGQSIRNADVHVRPPHMAQTSSPAKQWRHKPEMLIKGSCNYTAQYLGSTVVPELTAGTESTRAGITKLKLRFLRQLQKSTDILAKIPVIMLSISYKGVKFIDAKSKKVICDHEIGNIFCACQDTENLNFFAYITRDIETGQHYCHVFSVKSSSLAHDIILTLGESFEVAYQMALKEKSNEEAMELDRKMSHSDAEDTYSTVSKLSTNTV